MAVLVEGISVVVKRHWINLSWGIRLTEQMAVSRGLPRVIRTDNTKELRGKAMVNWARERGIGPRLIEPGKPNQGDYIESFNGRLRDECPNEQWFTQLLPARALVETWRRECNEERPKKAVGGLTPAAYAKQLAEVRAVNTYFKQHRYWER